MVGTVSDLTGSYFWDTEKLTPSQLLAKDAESLLPADDGWLVVRSHEWLERDSRSKAKALINHCIQSGGISVDTAADWAGHSTSRWPFTNWIGDYLHVLFTGAGPYSSLSTTIDTESLRLWASLGAGIIDDLKKGGTVKLSTLTEDSKTRIAQIVYWFEGLDDNAGDPTEKLPTGISEGFVNMTIKETPVFYGWSSGNKPPAVPMPMDAKQFGKFLAGGNSYWEIPAGVYRQYDRFRLGVNRKFSLHFALNPGAVPMTIELGETLFDPSGEAMTQLPAELRSATEQARLAAIAAPPKPPERTVIPPR
jgi:hypothetical protein